MYVGILEYIPKRPGGGVSAEKIVAADATAQPEVHQYIYIYGALSY
jgi:hypothetical protein